MGRAEGTPEQHRQQLRVNILKPEKSESERNPATYSVTPLGKCYAHCKPQCWLGYKTETVVIISTTQTS